MKHQREIEPASGDEFEFREDKPAPKPEGHHHLIDGPPIQLTFDPRPSKEGV